eukprot:CAMPEP_0170551628 /NCGR_PEP_ID=MMETSP0211-20121228/9632_1 /TAXON_ID=311385 /ORGANISM="Pseudokeronopsis sp., Strain OXSARD2" /LENGTH=98 /DNA_ID=CAMNT_0010858921 /DNA_START=851 /DNA_END=1147 /DNA_ORIENTATION=+
MDNVWTTLTAPTNLDIKKLIQDRRLEIYKEREESKNDDYINKSGPEQEENLTDEKFHIEVKEEEEDYDYFHDPTEFLFTNEVKPAFFLEKLKEDFLGQ